MVDHYVMDRLDRRARHGSGGSARRVDDVRVRDLTERVGETRVGARILDRGRYDVLHLADVIRRRRAVEHQDLDRSRGGVRRVMQLVRYAVDHRALDALVRQRVRHHPRKLLHRHRSRQPAPVDDEHEVIALVRAGHRVLHRVRRSERRIRYLVEPLLH